MSPDAIVDPRVDDARVEIVEDVCALPLVRRLAATLDRDPGRFRSGDPLPRGWHVCLFTVDTRQSLLRPDGAAGLGVTLPDVGLPRLMNGGRRIRFGGDIPIGAAVRRESRCAAVVPKQGRSGRMAVVTVRHGVYVDGGCEPVIEEEQDYVMREAVDGEPPAAPATADPPRVPGPGRPNPTITRTIVPDETLLFRYSAVMFNPHRIHYDFPYATAREGYPALVVNGTIPSLLLIEEFKAGAAREPSQVAIRNVLPLFCGRPMRVCAHPEARRWRLWVEDEQGRVAMDATVE